jgi:hypothetical protein
MVFKAVPTTLASWITVLPAVIKAILSSNVLFAVAKEDALRLRASPMSALDIAKLFGLLLSLI